MEMGRREFMIVGATSLSGATVLQTNTQLEGQPNEEYEFQGVAHLLGPRDARPAPGSQFFDDKSIYAYIYETPTGNRYFKRQSDSAWSLLVPPQDNSSASLDLDTEGTVTGSGDSPTLFANPPLRPWLAFWIVSFPACRITFIAFLRGVCLTVSVLRYHGLASVHRMRVQRYQPQHRVHQPVSVPLLALR